MYDLLCSGTVYHTEFRDQGSSIFCFLRQFCAKRRFDLGYFQGCLKAEIYLNDNRDVLLGNHYLALDINANIIKKNYFKFKEINEIR
jgi:hypothetical protein